MRSFSQLRTFSSVSRIAGCSVGNHNWRVESKLTRNVLLLTSVIVFSDFPRIIGRGKSAE